MAYQAEDKVRAKRVRTDQAIELAKQSRWDEAIGANQAIIAVFPDDSQAYNRLGKALSETGRIKEAREAYQHALELEPSNTIARKNLDRLAAARSKAEPDKAQQVDTSLFIEEMGKTGAVTLEGVNTKTMATLSAGDEVSLKVAGSRLSIETMAGDAIGDVTPRLALRLTRLMAGGNKYAAAVAGLDGDRVRVIIKETFQHPAQVGRLSFPAGKAGDVVRPYTRESLLRTDGEEDEELAEDPEDWEDADVEAEAELDVRETSLFEAAAAEDTDDSDFEE